MDSSTSKKPASTKGPGKSGRNAGKGRTFKQMIEAGNYTSRTLQVKLLMAHRTVKKAEENPSVLSLGDVYRLAHLMGEDVQLVLQDLLVEINALPEDQQPINQQKQSR